MARLIFIGIFLISLQAVAGQVFISNHGIRIRTHFKSPLTRPKRPGNKCSQAFALPWYQYKIRDVSDQGGSSVETRELPMNYQPHETVGLVASTLKRWIRPKRYTQKNADYLREVDDSLPPARTHYLEINYKEDQSTIRMFDDSEVPHYGEAPWKEVVGGKEARTPIERNYNYKLPARDSKNPFIIELGLLGNPSSFKDGLQAIAYHVADFIDIRYNNNSYKLFRDTKVIEDRNLKIYAVARPALARFHESLGFIKVMENGKPVRFHDGLFLLEYDGGAFIRFASEGPHLPRIDNYESPMKEFQLDPRWVNYLKLLDREAMPIIHNEADFWLLYNGLAQKYYHPLYNSKVGSQQRGDIYRNWMADLYQLYKSAKSQGYRSPEHVQEVMTQLRWLLGQETEAGIDHFLGAIYALEQVNQQIFNGTLDTSDWVKIDQE